MPPQENDEIDDSTIVSVHEGIEPDPEQSDEDETHLEPDQVEATPRRAMEQD
jgi:hypothetical protein